MIRPSSTTTAPTGTSPPASARRASSRASPMHRSSSASAVSTPATLVIGNRVTCCDSPASRHDLLHFDGEAVSASHGPHTHEDELRQLLDRHDACAHLHLG